MTDELQRLNRIVDKQILVMYMAIDDKLDERIFYLSPTGKVEDMKAAGMRMTNWTTDLAGFYLLDWNEYDNPSELLSSVVRTYGSAQLYGNEFGLDGIGLISKMRSKEPQFLMDANEELYRQFRMDLTEARVSNIRPGLNINYDKEHGIWMATVAPELASVDSNYKYVPALEGYLRYG